MCVGGSPIATLNYSLWEYRDTNPGPTSLTANDSATVRDEFVFAKHRC